MKRKVEVFFDARLEAGVRVIDSETGEDVTTRCTEITILPFGIATLGCRARLLKHLNGRGYFDPETEELAYEKAVVVSMSFGAGSVWLENEPQGKRAVRKFAVPVFAEGHIEDETGTAS
jgi:hypothetical protein